MNLPPEILKKLRRSRRLPTLPAVAVKLVELCNSDDVTIREVAMAVQQDPALAAKILRTANSPLFGLRRTVSSIDRAVQFMGLNATLSLALGFSLVRANKDGPGGRFDFDAYWRRCITTATAARALAPYAMPHPAEELMLAGLLQDLGVLALHQALGADYDPVVTTMEGREHSRLARVEQKLLDTNHAAVGTWVMERWQLPGHLVKATQDHHSSPHRLVGAEPVTRVAAVASAIADIWEHPQPARAIKSAKKAGSELLRIRSSIMDSIIEAVNREAPEIGVLFEVSAHGPIDIERLLEEAQDAREVLHLKSELRTRRTEQMATNLALRLRELESEAQHDQLTRVYSRGHIHEFLARHLDASLRLGTDLAVLFLDLDHFKRINDTLGHNAGDQVLRTVGAVFQHAVRDQDAVGRWGGEEFLIVLPWTPPNAAKQVAERIRATLERTPITIDESPRPLKVTVSIGVANVDHDAFPEVEDLVRDADAALYEAKRSGRNQVYVSELSPA